MNSSNEPHQYSLPPLALPVHYVLGVEVLQSHGNLGSVEDGASLLEAWAPHIMDVELEVPAVHNGQNETQGILRLKRVRQAYLKQEELTRRSLARLVRYPMNV